ncbi:MAG TPA: glycosyltransferase family 2 protein [Candidatus Paceibacterota bacterium]
MTQSLRHKKITVVTPCFNEEANVAEVYRQVKEVFAGLPQYEYEHIFIDNASTDKTVGILNDLASRDRSLKIIVNARNFGYVRSPFYAVLQAEGDAVVTFVADLQDPAILIKDFIKKWEEGYKIVIGIINESNENSLMFGIRKFYYYLVKKCAEVELINHFNGFGLYDKQIVEILRKFDDPYPYFRGLISEVGFPRAEIKYTQTKREKGKSVSNFYTLYDVAMLGFVSHSKLPLRLASFIGFGASIISFFLGLAYLIYKLLFWYSFELGLAPLIIGLFFFASIQLFFIGVIGEYIGAIYTQVRKRPLVVEKERVNFDQ